MAIPTVNQLAQTLMREFGDAIDNASLLSQYQEWIKDAYDEIGIATEWRHQWSIDTFSTVANISSYNMDGGFEQEISIKHLSDDTPLLYSKRQALMEQGVNIELTGKPREWYVKEYDEVNEQFVIALYPVPDAIYQMEIFGHLRPVELITSTKLPFPREFLFLLKDCVRIKIREDRKDYAGADRVKSRYRESLNKLISRNKAQIGMKQRMQVQDIPRSSNNFVRLPPEHFG